MCCLLSFLLCIEKTLFYSLISVPFCVWMILRSVFSGLKKQKNAPVKMVMYNDSTENEWNAQKEKKGTFRKPEEQLSL